MLNILSPKGLLLWLVCCVFLDDARSNNISLTFDGGTFYGPGNMPDAPMPDGKVETITLTGFLSGKTEYFNNGHKNPNLRARDNYPLAERGQTSDGKPFNEFMDGGVVEIGMGAMNLLTVVTSGGSNEGEQRYHLTEDLNWEVRTDLALDPGFEQGVLVIDDLRITSGVVWLKPSRQADLGMPGGTEAAGSLIVGDALVGRLGDKNEDGYLDGILVGTSTIPIGHIFSPGAPAAQSRSFSTTIPISKVDSLVLELSGLTNYRMVWNQLGRGDRTEARRTLWQNHVKELDSRMKSFSAKIKKHMPRFSQEADQAVELITQLSGKLGDANADHVDQQDKTAQQMFSVLAELKNTLLELPGLQLTVEK